ncbi:hypothetical protein J4411_04015 [Candidatus Pacearchaeota archaeon]|nr:hypothetical protein [Candidatus Pacearchaeota archaeon]
MNKRGWIKIIEAFMAIVLLLGFLFVIIGNYNSSQIDNSAVQKNNLAVLNGIENDLTLRNLVFLAELDSSSDDFGFPQGLKDYLEEKTPVGQNCSLYICSLESPCTLNSDVNTQIYSSQIILFSDSSSYSPRKLKIFCHGNEVLA